jgi:hypothetical protein
MRRAERARESDGSGRAEAKCAKHISEGAGADSATARQRRGGSPKNFGRKELIKKIKKNCEPLQPLLSFASRSSIFRLETLILYHK